MSAFDFLLHLSTFVAPAVFMALALALCAWGMRAKGVWPWYVAAVVNAVAGTAVLTLGVVLFGHDGRMATYAALVLVMACGQWLMTRGWRV